MIRLVLACVATLALSSVAAVAQDTRELSVPLTGGKLSTLALTRALLEEYGYGGDAVEFEDLQLDVGGLRGALAIRALDKALGDVARVRKADGGKALVVTIDRGAVQDARRDGKRRVLRAIGALVGRDLLARRYELTLPAGLADDATIVVCIHGVDSSARTFEQFREGLAPVPSGTFNYANDESIGRIATEFSQRLKAHAERCPDSEVLIVAHSMGGLVARCAIEDPALDPGNVRGLLMVGTPNHGSRVARMRMGNDIIELLRRDGLDPRLLRPWLDGLGEAGWDLRVSSPFLKQLNARPRNPAVDYELVLGNVGLIGAEELDEIRTRFVAKLEAAEEGGVFAPKLDAVLRDVAEIVEGKGDGAVSVARSKLDGVPTLVVRARHNSLLDDPAVIEHARAWIAERNGNR